MDLPKRQNCQKNSIRFQMPDLPPEMWCDFRVGKQSVPTKIQIYEPHIRNLLLNMKTVPDDICTIYSLSRYLYPLLQQQGYTGSERTLRNHLSSQPYIKAFLEKTSILNMEHQKMSVWKRRTYVTDQRHPKYDRHHNTRGL